MSDKEEIEEARRIIAKLRGPNKTETILRPNSKASELAESLAKAMPQ